MPQGQQVPPELREPLARQEPREPLVLQGPPVPPELREPLALQELLVLQGLLARQGPREPLVLLPRQYMHNKENAVTMRLSAH